VWCLRAAGSTGDDRRSRTTVMEMSSCYLCPGKDLTSTSTGDVSEAVASGAVYYGQFDIGPEVTTSTLTIKQKDERRRKSDLSTSGIYC